MMEVAATNGAVRQAKLQSNRHHQQTNTFKHNLSDAKTTVNSNVCYHVVLLVNTVDEPSTIKTKAVKNPAQSTSS